ncbi:hypothetical protein [Mucilaginibacter sp.]
MKTKVNNLKSKIQLFSKTGALNKIIASLLLSPLTWIMLTCGIVRVLYYSTLLNTQDVDSPSYLNYNYNLFKGEIGGFRTPVYPYFIKLIGFFNEQNLIENVTIWQSIISFLTIALFYSSACIILKSKQIAGIATLVYGLMFPLINFDKIIRTESLSISVVVLFLYLIISYITAPKTYKAMGLSFYSFFALMLRPSFIFLIPFLILFWVIRFLKSKQEMKTCFYGIGSCIIVIFLIVGYSRLNDRENGFNGISSVTNINQLDILIYDNMYMNGNDPELSNSIKIGLTKPQTLGGHWNLLAEINAKYPPHRISQFISQCIKSQPGAYIKGIYHTTTSLKTENIFTNYAERKTNSLATIIDGLESFIFYITFNLFYIFLLVDLIVNITEFIKHKRILWFKIVLWIISFAQLAVAIIGAQGEYQRLIVPCIPSVILLLFCYIDRYSYSIDKKRLDNYNIY